MILAGGVGSRFWPVSTPGRPKQLLPLASERPLIVDTVDRALGLVPRERLRILTGEHLVGPISTVLSGPSDDLFLVEPAARGTAPVLAWAAHELASRDPEAVLVSLHSDHVIEPLDALHRVLDGAARLAREERLLVTVGAEPDRPATGYGYVRPGEPLESPRGVDAFRVDSFVEKPDAATARRYLGEGYLWNTGIFVWRADVFLEQVRRWAPEVAEHLPLLDAGDVEGFFGAVRSITVDVAVLERSDRVATIRAPFRWDDVGSWGALPRTLPRDAGGNVSVGDVHLVEASDNTVVSEDGSVVLFGVEDLVVVRTSTVTLVTRRDRAPDLKRLLTRLPPELRDPEA